jgi:hypothetical protein
MVDKYKYSTSQLLNFTRDSYLERTSRPIYALVFLLPFIVFYELGTILINTDVLNRTQDRVVAFIWLQSFLDSYLGLGSRFAWVAPPLTVVIVLLALQITSRKRWYFAYADIVPMTIECILLAAPLIVLSLILSGPAESNSNITPSGYASLTQVVADCSEGPSAPSIVEVKPRLRIEGRRTVPVCSSLISCELRSASARTNSNNERSSHLLANIVTGIGAGIYEELIFRLILICVLMMLFQDVMGFEHKNSIILSVLISAALFSAHHHIVFVNGQVSLTAPFNRTVFGFRTIAGVYFAALFAIRGFGITAGTHAFYDIIATIINIVFFHH